MRHGLDTYSHGGPALKPRLYEMYLLGTFFALMRFISGFGGFILHAEDSDSLKIKFIRCIEVCQGVHQEMRATGKARGIDEIIID